MKDAIEFLENKQQEEEKTAERLEKQNNELDAINHWCNVESIKYSLSILKAGNKQVT
jgi:hypothetical protein